MAKVKEVDIDIETLNAAIEASSDETSIYIGADSKTFKRGAIRYVAFCTTVIIHKDSKHGGKIYKDIKIEVDKGDIKKPRLRLMKEVYMVIGIASKIVDAVGDRHFEIHLDVNPDPRYKSYTAVKEACGTVLGTFPEMAMKAKGRKKELVKVKPEAWAASAVADRDAVETAKHAKL